RQTWPLINKREEGFEAQEEGTERCGPLTMVLELPASAFKWEDCGGCKGAWDEVEGEGEVKRGSGVKVEKGGVKREHGRGRSGEVVDLDETTDEDSIESVILDSASCLSGGVSILLNNELAYLKPKRHYMGRMTEAESII
ncbi:hypothetical protein HK097_009909, partial [Rhizophlyctis rosea]